MHLSVILQCSCVSFVSFLCVALECPSFVNTSPSLTDSSSALNVSVNHVIHVSVTLVILYARTVKEEKLNCIASLYLMVCEPLFVCLDDNYLVKGIIK